MHSLPIMSQKGICCRFCKRKDFANGRALTQHMQRNSYCSRKYIEEESGYVTAYENLNFQQILNNILPSGTKRVQPQPYNVQQGPTQMANQFNYGTKRHDKLQYEATYYTAEEDNSDEDGAFFGAEYDEEEKNEPFLNPEAAYMRDKFAVYVRNARHNVQFSTHEAHAIKLMSILRRTRAPLGLYDEIMEWHLKANRVLREHEKLSNTWQFLSRKRLFENLRQRYDINNSLHQQTIVLPSSSARVNIVYSDANIAVKSLLTDPRILPEDYLFWNDDPFSPPPEEIDHLGDINTGLAYTKTWQKLIKKPNKQILCPIIFYIDGSQTGHFAEMPITPVKITLGIFNRNARNKGHLWRTIGYIPHVQADKSRGKRLLIESGHVEGTRVYAEAMENEGIVDSTSKEASKAQDLHTMLDLILKSYVTMEETGFVWDFCYKNNVYKDTEFVMFVPFIKCDTDEADKLCGSYTSRGWGVSQLCRYCTCPLEKSDSPNANYSFKTPKMVQTLINRKDLDGLKAISQQNIQNAWYRVDFGYHNDHGVHSATPLEMLHHILLGIFKYVRDCFFEQLGNDSEKADDIDALCKIYGELLDRQSDRDLPKTKFNNGIRTGKLMAKEYSGIILLLTVALKSAKGRAIAGKRRQFASDTYVLDWIMLLETLITWECWLKSDYMELRHVKRAEKKNRYIMYLIKKVGRRSKGMGLKTTKFHGICHLATDILNFGVPDNVNTDFNEAHHKPSKDAAKLTQKSKDTFDVQTAIRLEERELLCVATEEMAGRPLWEYHLGHYHSDPVQKKEAPAALEGASLRVEKEDDGPWRMGTIKKKKLSHDVMVEDAIPEFLGGLKTAIPDVGELHLYTTYKRKGNIFRASPHYRGKVWRDWVIVDWGVGWGKLPNKLWGFLDLRSLPLRNRYQYGGLNGIPPGIYGIVESVTACNSELDTDLLSFVETEVESMTDGFVDGLKFYLADVDAFVEPAIIIPDIGGPNNRYMHVKGRHLWSNIFEKWLDDPHVEDIVSESEDESDNSNEIDDED